VRTNLLAHLELNQIPSLLLAVGLLATSGCISTHLINDKARSHPNYSEEEQQINEVAGDPRYYALLPLTLVGDAVTSPVQVVLFIFSDGSHWNSACINAIPIPLP